MALATGSSAVNQAVCNRLRSGLQGRVTVIHCGWKDTSLFGLCVCCAFSTGHKQEADIKRHHRVALCFPSPITYKRVRVRIGRRLGPDPDRGPPVADPCSKLSF
ncbi:hypothetical protein NQZ68_013906 [Dissostichus eleginoides]|nr:hypothetical protein NQZ68_013906 [Dissostichus eleginoides]